LLAALRRIGENGGPAVLTGVDFTHFDFQFLNPLSDGHAITGVIDVNPPPRRGDRAFGLATLLFYVYDTDELRRAILDRLSGLASRPAVRRTPPTWCSARWGGRSATIPAHPPPGIISASPGSSWATSASRPGITTSSGP
jgi:hypothetical protein